MFESSKSQQDHSQSIDAIALLPQLRSPSVSQAKRFLEYWAADEQFREQLLKEPDSATKQRGLEVNPQLLRQFWDPEFKEKGTGGKLGNEKGEMGEKQKKRTGQKTCDNAETGLATEYLAFRKTKLDYAQQIKQESAPLEPRFRSWRQRQMARVRTEFSRELNEAIVHPVFAIELNKGCSGGCAFCGLSAGKLDACFTYSLENAKLWQEVLQVLHSFTGNHAGRWGFLYWGTEPFDNPDYERFCLDFSDVFGIFPHTTTVMPLKDVERTRRFIKLAEEHHCLHNRFSILSLDTLKKVHQAFTPEELCMVELVLHNEGSVLKRFQTGRARNVAIKQARKSKQKYEELPGQTIACVSGFLLNMVERSVQLISPCTTDHYHPQGYYVYAHEHFEDAAHLNIVIKQMIREFMPKELPLNTALRFRRDLNHKSLEDGFQVKTLYGTHSFNNNPFLNELGEWIAQGKYTGQELMQYFKDSYLIEPSTCHQWLNWLFDNGVLDDEPGLIGDRRNKDE